MIEGQARGSEMELDSRLASMVVDAYLELVLAGLCLRCWVEEINSENL
jgi:hypothetical protein